MITIHWGQRGDACVPWVHLDLGMCFTAYAPWPQGNAFELVTGDPVSLLRNVAGVAHVLDSAAFGSLSFGCVLDQVRLGEGEDKAGEGVCAQVAFLVAEGTCCSLSLSLFRCCPQSSCLKILYLGCGKVCACTLEWSGWSIVLEQSCSKPADQGLNHCKGLPCSLGLPTLTVMAGLGAQVSQAEAACSELSRLPA